MSGMDATNDDGAIRDVSDTALWVAMYRALESERPDAHFRDPYARRLAGPRGEAILDAIPDGRETSWPMVVRTCVFDEIILRAVRERGVETVLNLAAGLDARPYRLDLPAGLEWIEVDKPEMIDRKESELAAEAPRCRLSRVRMDLADLGERRALFDRLDAAGKRTLVITEGLVLYLTAEAVTSLAYDLHERPSLRWWLVDFASPELVKMLEKRWGPTLRSAPFRFAPAEGTAFFAKRGWEPVEERFPADDARRLKREMPYAWLYRFVSFFMSASTREKYRRYSTYALLERA
jgi:methyltransferase (TIGR00027 family)